MLVVQQLQRADQEQLGGCGGPSCRALREGTGPTKFDASVRDAMSLPSSLDIKANACSEASLRLCSEASAPED